MTRDFNRISMHGVHRELLQRQAAELGLAVDEVWISQGAANAEYEAQMHEQLVRLPQSRNQNGGIRRYFPRRPAHVP